MGTIDPKAAGRRGGRERATRLSADERARISRSAAHARWDKQRRQSSDLPRAICGGEDHPLEIGDVRIPCYVLEDERRVITMRGMSGAVFLNSTASGGAPRMASYLLAIGRNSQRAKELAVRLGSPIVFQPRAGGGPAHGYEAILLADICDAILAARQADLLTTGPQFAVADRAELLIRGWARVGIVAMVDEATGFQYVRSRKALAEILAKFISDRLMPWTKRFPDEFYTELFRLKGWDYVNLKPGDAKPSVVGWYTRNIVYERLAPGVIQELERLNPPTRPGRRAHRHHQWLTEDIGHSGLREHLAKIVTTMQLSADWDAFRSNLRRVLPRRWEQLQFEDVAPPSSEDTLVPPDDGLD